MTEKEAMKLAGERIGPIFELEPSSADYLNQDPQLIYQNEHFDPAEYFVFSFYDRMNVSVGASNFAMVNKATGEVSVIRGVGE